MKETLIVIKDIDISTIKKVLSEYHELSDGIVPSYIIELRQISLDTYVLCFPSGITYNEFENLLDWFNAEIKSEKDIYGYHTTKRFKGVKSSNNAMFWIEPSNNKLMICRQDGLTYSETDNGFKIDSNKRQYIPLDVQWKTSSSLLETYSFVYVDVAKSGWKLDLIIFSNLIVFVLLLLFGGYAYLSTILTNTHLIIIGIISLIVSLCFGWHNEDDLFEKIEKRFFYLLESFFVIASIAISINYYLRIEESKQQIVVIEGLCEPSDNKGLHYAKFSFPPNNNIKVEKNVTNDFYNTLELGDTCIADYRKGILGITVIDSLYKPK